MTTRHDDWRQMQRLTSARKADAMSTPSAEERVSQAFNDYYNGTDQNDDLFRHIVDAIRAAEDAARAEQREVDCRAVCKLCREGYALGEVMITGAVWHRVNGRIRKCDAQTIRAEKER